MLWAMSHGDMAGKTVLITGATGGIGLVTARELALQGARVTIVGRDASKTAQVAREINASKWLVADLGELSQVRRVAAEYREHADRLDVLINNAGAHFQKRQETSEGIERTWALNHLSPFLLTRELLSLLLVTPGARVVTVSSAAHQSARIRFDDPEFKAGYNGWAAYAQSKLANILFARELARRGAGIQSNALHPGVVATGFGHSNRGRFSQMYRLADRFAVTPEVGAQTSVMLASDPYINVSGGYFEKGRPTKPSAHALDDAAAARLWTLSESYVVPADEMALRHAVGHLPWPEILREVREITQEDGSEES